MTKTARIQDWLSIPLTELPLAHDAHSPPRDAEVIFSPNYALARARSLEGEALIAPHSQNAAPSPIISDFYSQFSRSQFASPHFLGGRRVAAIQDLVRIMVTSNGCIARHSLSVLFLMVKNVLLTP